LIARRSNILRTRVDALVWALTELLVEPMKGAAIFEVVRQLASGKTLYQIAGIADPKDEPTTAATEPLADHPKPKNESLLEVHRREAARLAALKK
jgi:hypothetical protein